MLWPVIKLNNTIFGFVSYSSKKGVGYLEGDYSILILLCLKNNNIILNDITKPNCLKCVPTQ